MSYKNMVWAVIGAVVGAAIGAAATYKWSEHKFEVILEEEMKAYRDYWHKKQQVIDEKKEDAEPEDQEKTEDESDNVADIPESVIEASARMRKNPNQKTAYNKIAKQYNTATSISEKVDPVVVTEDEYNNNETLQEVQLFYDSVNCHVWDEHGEAVEEIDDTLGYENLDYMDEKKLDTIYIRNDNHNTIYVVDRDDADEPNF